MFSYTSMLIFAVAYAALYVLASKQSEGSKLKIFVRAGTVVSYFVFTVLCLYTNLRLFILMSMLYPSITAEAMDYTKKQWVILLISIQQMWAPSKIEVYTDDNLEGSFYLVNGQLHSRLDKHAILIANHVLYSDWIYLWWISYSAKLSGAITIALKSSLRKVPLLGTGMFHWNFLFLEREWGKDQKNIEKAMTKLTKRVEPAWMLIFPEGTTRSRNGVAKSEEYSAKSGIPMLKNVLLPRSKGLHAILNGLNGSKYKELYDVTFYYAGVPDGQYGEDYYSLKAMYAQGIIPKNIGIHIRKFKVSEIPYDQGEQIFGDWLLKIWKEKNDLIDMMKAHDERLGKPMETAIQLNNILEICIPYTAAIFLFVCWKLISRFLF